MNGSNTLSANTSLHDNGDVSTEQHTDTPYLCYFLEGKKEIVRAHRHNRMPKIDHPLFFEVVRNETSRLITNMEDKETATTLILHVTFELSGF